MFEMSLIWERTEALASASAETVEWAPFRKCDLFSNLSFVGRDTPFPKNQRLPFKDLLRQRRAVCLCHFSKSTHTNTCWKSVYQKKRFAVLGACTPTPLSCLVTGEAAQGTELVLFPVFTAKGSPRKTSGTTSSAPCYFNQGGHGSPQCWTL